MSARSSRSPARIGLWVFMAVVTSLFGLFLSAYAMRMHHGVGWCHLTSPNILWINTAVLVAAASRCSSRASGRARPARMARTALIAGGCSTLAFLAGQVAAWQQFGPSLYFMPGQPGDRVLLPADRVHGLHVLGGLLRARPRGTALRGRRAN